MRPGSRRSRSRRTPGGSGDLSSVTTALKDPRHRRGVRRQPDSGRPDQPDRQRDPEQSRRSIRCRTAPCSGGSPATTSARRSRRSAPTRATGASTGARRTTTRSSAASRSPSTSRRTTSARFPLLLGNLTTAPFRNLALNWNRVIKPSLVNEVLVGYNQITIVSDTLDWAGIGDANATFGIAGGQPIRGPQLDRMGQRADVDRRGRERHQHASTRPIRSTRS